MNEAEYETTGKAIASGIGTVLTSSGALDHLVPEGKEPDPDQVYIYNHHHVWRKDAPFFERCVEAEPGRERAIKVRRGARGVGYEFELAGEPGVVYTSNYGWSLVPDTPNNVLASKVYREMQSTVRALQERCGELLKNISLA